MLRYNIENLSADHLDTIIETLDGDGDGQQIAAVWIAKEHLRALLALRPPKRTSRPPQAPSGTSSPPSTAGARTTMTSPR